MDRRLLNLTMKQFFNRDILIEEYSFSPSKVYYLPQDGTMEEYSEYINNLPINDKIEIFGLHPNSDIIIATE